MYNISKEFLFYRGGGLQPHRLKLLGLNADWKLATVAGSLCHNLKRVLMVCSHCYGNGKGKD